MSNKQNDVFDENLHEVVNAEVDSILEQLKAVSRFPAHLTRARYDKVKRAVDALQGK